MSTTSQLSASLLLVQQILTHYGYSAMVALGNFGNLLNIFLFLRKTLRTTSCNTYFLASAFTNLVALNVGIISLLYVYDRPTTITPTYCKSRSYVLNTSQQMSRFLIVAACFDRFALCSTSARLRKICQVRIARRYIIPSIIIFWLVIPLHIPIFYTISGNTCVFPSAIALYNSIYGIIMAGSLPPALMLVFSLLIFRNLKLRQRRRHIHPLPVVTSIAIGTRRQQIKDKQVLKMLLIQVFVYVTSTIPYTISLLYNFMTMNEATSKSNERKSIEAFATFFAGVLIFVCPCFSFYLFILSSHLFRKELKSIVLQACGRRQHGPWIINNNRNTAIGNTSLRHKVTARLEMTQRRMAMPLSPVVAN